MLDLRPNCQLCDCDLPPSSDQARICSYECTYCATCVETVLHNVCPTCAGNFVPRPIRPQRAWREGKIVGLGHHPAGTQRRHVGFSTAEITAFVTPIKGVPPNQR